MRALALLLLLAGCTQACPAAFTVSPAPRATPLPAPAPDSCVEEWYARADTPACVDAWIDRLAAHRNRAKGRAAK